MKKGSFWGLLYCEWALMKKHLLIISVSGLCMAAMAFLAVLSFRFGNLADLIDEDTKKLIFEDLALVAKAFPAICACFALSAPVDAATNETKTVWVHFRRSTPANGFRLALAKFTVMTALTVFSAATAIGATALSCAILGTDFAVSDIAISLAMLAVFVVLCVIMYVCLILFKSRDKGGLAACGVFAVCLLSVVIPATDNMPAGMTGLERFNFFVEKATDFLPFIPIVIVAALLLGLFATTMIYKRREK